MKIPYAQFERLNLGRARIFVKDILDPLAAQKLCRAAYDSLDAAELTNRPTVNVRLAMLNNEMFAVAHESDTARVARLIFRGLADEPADWIPFSATLTKLAPILSDLLLYNRAIAALYILRWEAPDIKELFNTIILQLGEDIRTASTIPQFTSLVHRTKAALNSYTEGTDADNSWFQSLVKHEDPVGDFETVRKLRKMSQKRAAERFARKNASKVEPNREISDPWNKSKLLIADRLGDVRALMHGSRGSGK